ncbi:hypothetical protein PAMA_009601 [Pampus argenteus]
MQQCNTPFCSCTLNECVSMEKVSAPVKVHWVGVNEAFPALTTEQCGNTLPPHVHVVKTGLLTSMHEISAFKCEDRPSGSNQCCVACFAATECLELKKSPESFGEVRLCADGFVAADLSLCFRTERGPRSLFALHSCVFGTFVCQMKRLRNASGNATSKLNASIGLSPSQIYTFLFDTLAERETEKVDRDRDPCLTAFL